MNGNWPAYSRSRSAACQAGAPSLQASRPITVRFGKTTGHVDAALALGGTITGTVRFKTPRGRPLAGICVFGMGLGAVSSVLPDGVTGKDGRYALVGLPTGRYSLSFGAEGCGNRGDFLFQNDPHPVSVTVGRATRGVNIYLQPGGAVSGTVRSAADGKPLPGICVFVNDPDGDATRTTKAGTFRIEQIPAGRYPVGFSGGCGSRGSYAPEWYRDRAREVDAGLVTIRAGRVTRAVDAAMRPGAAVAGHVTATSGRPLSGICVTAVDPELAGFFGSGFTVGATQTSAGNYVIANLAAGQYQVIFFSCGRGHGYATQWFPARQDEGSASLLDVPAATTVTGIDAALAQGGAISGTVRATGSSPLDFYCVSAYAGRSSALAGTASFIQYGRRYDLTGLPAGRYLVEFSDCSGSGYASEWYRGQPGERTADPVSVSAGRTTAGIDAELTRGNGSISGRVTDKATGKPVRGACVAASSARDSGHARANPRGQYRIVRLPAARYHVTGFSCSGGGPYPAQPRPGLVRVAPGGVVTGIDIALVRGGSMSGTVRGGPGPGAAEPGVCVIALPVGGSGYDGYGVTKQGGGYVIPGLVAGSYLVYFSDVLCTDGTQGFAPQWYRGQVSRAAATPVVVAAGAAVTGIDADLARDGSITGTVTGPGPAGPPLAGICVQAVPVHARTGAVDSVSPVITVSRAGRYVLAGVIPGAYLVRFGSGCGATGYATQWWRAARTPAAATVVTVAPGAASSGIDAAMRS